MREQPTLLLSMTGHGAASAQSDQVHVLAEVRAVNNRFLKVSVSGDLDAAHQSLVEAMVRERIQRGSVTVRLQLQFTGANTQYQINASQLTAYREQLSGLNPGGSELNALLQLPGVVTEVEEDSRIQAAWPTIESALQEALDHFVAMRAKEGQAMRDDLVGNCDLIAERVAGIQKLAPGVVDGYAKRITERINRMLQEHDVSVTTSDLIREVGIFAERIDVSEELVRLSSHIEQFRSIAGSDESDGRKLDFLTQELLRETNTIGSKANDAEISNLVVEMKSIIERIREMTQNIE